MRLVKNKSFQYGKQSFSVEAKTEAQLDALTAELKKLGWRDECTDCCEDNGYDGEGYTMEFAVDCQNEQAFKAAFKVAKNNLK